MPLAPRGWAGSLWRVRPTLVRVRGRSMTPTLRDGDLLLAVRGIPVREGGLALVRLPHDRSGAPRPVAVKRLRRDPGDPSRWWVDSDNPAEGVTSFDIGTLGDAAVLARVVWRLPRGR